MAKVIVDVDTETKELSVSVNGKEIKNARSANFYMGRDEKGNPYWIEASVNIREFEDDIEKMTTYYACGTEKEKFLTEANLLANSDIEGFVCVEKQVEIEESVASHINKFFESSRKK